MFDEKDISRMRGSEAARGRKTPASLRRKAERLETLLLVALESGDRRLFERTLIDLGQPPESEEHRRSMEIFDDYHARK
jgi:hypothetical protein